MFLHSSKARNILIARELPAMTYRGGSIGPHVPKRQRSETAVGATERQIADVSNAGFDCTAELSRKNRASASLRTVLDGQQDG